MGIHSNPGFRVSGPPHYTTDFKNIVDFSLAEAITVLRIAQIAIFRGFFRVEHGFYFDFFVLGPQLDEDEAKRSRIKVLRERFNDLVYEYSDIEEEEQDHDHDNNQTGAKITETELNCDLHQALIIGLEILDLMNDLHMKCRTRLFFCNEVLEVAEDCAAAGDKNVIIDKSAAAIAEHGYFLSRIVSGYTAETTLKWKSKLKQDK